MNRKCFFQRNIMDELKAALTRSPVVLLAGARQTGKTTLIKKLFENKKSSYTSFDSFAEVAAAKEDLTGFLKNKKFPLILDEVQKVPEIFSSIKIIVDEHDQPGMFAITGSANPLLLPKLSDSLAGRMEIINLFPLSQGEINGKKENFIEYAFSSNIKELKPEFLSIDDLCKKMLTGGYPRVQNSEPESLHKWFDPYLITILEKDIKELSQIEKATKLPDLLGLLASRAGSLLNVAELSRSSKINASTLHRYLSLLKTLFIVHLVKPWSKNLSKRFVKSPKVYLDDSGLLLNLLKINCDGLLSNKQIFGPALENFVLTELLKQSSWSNHPIDIFHYRTNTGIEVDIVLEGKEKRIVGIEVKSKQSIKASDFKGLKYLEKDVGQSFVAGIVLYTGDKCIPFGKNLWALPISTLWS